MSLIYEIIRAFFVAFGAAQTISNSSYLLKKNGLEFARKQHKELPSYATNKQIKVKVVCMLSFGVLFLAIGLFSYFTRSYVKLNFIITLGAYMVYALIEAMYYKYWKVYGAFAIAATLFLIALFS